MHKNPGFEIQETINIQQYLSKGTMEINTLLQKHGTKKNKKKRERQKMIIFLYVHTPLIASLTESLWSLKFCVPLSNTMLN